MSIASPIEFFFDFSSPYSYVASEWIDTLAARHGRTVRWNAILLGVTFQAAQIKSPVSYPLKREYSLQDFARSARFEGLPYRMPERFPIPSHNAARVFWWLDARDPSRAVAWAHACFRAYFAQGKDPSQTDQLLALATEFDLHPEEVQAVWNDPVWKDRLKQANEAAVAAGVFGAPFFLVDGEPFWGNDRKSQIERWLAEGAF